MFRLAVGDRVGDRYQLVAVAPERGLGEVWRALDVQRSGAEVMVEFLRAEDPALRVALRAARLFRHPSVAAVVHHGQAADARFVAYEWAPGESLATLLRTAGDAPMDLAFLREIGERVAAAVEAGHRAASPVLQGLVAPASVVVTRRDRGVDVKLLDFGLAGVAHDARSATARAGVAQAPEGWRGERASVQTDVFALGALWTELLSVPSDGGLARRADVPESVWSVLAEALSIDPAARFETVEAFSTALDAAWSHASVRASLSGRAPSLLESLVQRGPSLTAPHPIARAPAQEVSATSAPILGPMPELAPPRAPEALNPWSSAVLSAEVAVPLPARPVLEATLVERAVPTTQARAVLESTFDVAAPNAAFQRPTRRLQAGEATFERAPTKRADDLNTTLPLPPAAAPREAAIAPAPAPLPTPAPAPTRRRPVTQDFGDVDSLGPVVPQRVPNRPLEETLDTKRDPAFERSESHPLPHPPSAFSAPVVGAGLALAVLAVAAVVYAIASR